MLTEQVHGDLHQVSVADLPGRVAATLPEFAPNLVQDLVARAGDRGSAAVLAQAPSPNSPVKPPAEWDAGGGMRSLGRSVVVFPSRGSRPPGHPAPRCSH